MRHLHDALPPGRQGRHFADAGEAAAGIAGLIGPGDTVLVKGRRAAASPASLTRSARSGIRPGSGG